MGDPLYTWHTEPRGSRAGRLGARWAVCAAGRHGRGRLGRCGVACAWWRESRDPTRAGMGARSPLCTTEPGQMPTYRAPKRAIVRLFCTLPTPRSIPVSSSRPARLRSRRAHSRSASIRRRRTRGAIMFCIAHAPNCQISNVGGARMLHMRRYRSKSSRNIIVPPQRILSTSLAARHTRETFSTNTA